MGIARREAASSSGGSQSSGGGGGGSSLGHHEIAIAVLAGSLITIIVLLLIVVFYLLRSRYSKPSSTDEERQKVLDKKLPTGANTGSYASGKYLDINKNFKPADPNQQQYNLKLPYGYANRPTSSSSIRSGRALKDRRKLSTASNDSLTLSIASDKQSISGAGAGAAAVPATPRHHPKRSQKSSINQYDTLSRMSRPLTVEALKLIVTNLGQLSAEFMNMPTNHPESVDTDFQKSKNRFPGVLPNNQSRIRLSGRRYQTPAEGYINANFVRGYKKECAFIASQGALPDTVSDFWWMVWQENVSVIVMLTRTKERNRQMCEKYWPIKYSTYGDILVTCEYTLDNNPNYTLNGFLIAEIESANQRRVEQYCYLDWPDKETPSDARGLVAMIEEIRKQQGSSSSASASAPILVHCSAGIGRTGCYIALSSAIDQYTSEGTIDILGTVAHIRLDRGGLVQNLEQYEFVHKVLLQYINGHFDQQKEEEEE